MKNSLAALLADDKARVVPRQHKSKIDPHRPDMPWFFSVTLYLPDGILEYAHIETYPTRSEAELAGEALRDKAKEQVNK